MRKSLWTILVVFVFTALGSTSARADMIVASGGNVTAINGITIAGTTYNVTFGTTMDTTFAGNASNASTANAAILADLASGTYLTAGGACYVGVDGGVTTYFAANFTSPHCSVPNPPLGWSAGINVTSVFAADVLSMPAVDLWDEFTVVATPEPGTLLLTLTGVGLLGLTLVLRKRKAHGLAQTS